MIILHLKQSYRHTCARMYHVLLFTEIVILSFIQLAFSFTYTSVYIHNVKQGEVDRICDYTLDAVVGVDDVQLLSDDNNAPLQSGGNVIYTLTANQYVYFPSFEISTDAGPQSVLLPNFSKDKCSVKYVCPGYRFLFTLSVVSEDCIILYVYIFPTATFDVQVFTASGEDSWITVTGEFINDTLATGCFIVIQSNSSTADIYRALLRQDSEQTVSGNISVPPSVYTVYAYDLEENALPYPLPAISSGTPITINTPHGQYIYTCYCVHNYL